MLWFKFIDYVKTPFTTNNLVVGANLFDTCTYFHNVRIMLLPAMTHCLNNICAKGLHIATQALMRRNVRDPSFCDR